MLSPFPPSFRDPSVPLPATASSYRPGPVAPIGRGPLVYVSLGTVFNTGSGDLFKRLLAGLAAVPAEVLVTVGRDIDPADFGDQPAHVTIERYVAQADVLPRCGLVVSHGGSGSLMGALAHGLPSVLTPARRRPAAQRATGRRPRHRSRVLDAATATPDEIGRTVTAMLADTGARDAALALKAEIDALPPVEATVPLLEQLAGHYAG